MQDILIKNGKVILFKDEDVKVEKKDILIKDSKIFKIDNKIESEIEDKKIKIIDAKNHIVMPGFINTHAHIPMSIFRETTEGCKLYEWLNEKIWPREEKLTKEDVYWTSMLSYIEMISTGTTCVNDHYFISEAIRKAAQDSKVRTVLTRVLMDVDGKEALENRVNEFENLYETRDKNSELITYTVSPHSLYTCSDECLKISTELAQKYNLPVHVHFLESIDEIEDIKEKHGCKAIEVLEKYFKDVSLILAHGVHLDNYDIEKLKNMDCGIAHNPISNMRLGCTVADTTRYLKEKINVALGTDGQGSRK